MSTTVDSRVVEMRFDNRQFERNVSDTMSTLDKLKQKLNFTGASQGLESVNSAAKNVNMAGLGSAVEAVSMKFSALQVMGITALTNITNQAVNAGKRIASALTIDPIKTGFSEYETQINAVQTILANTESKGTTLQDVNRALDELNTYADKTIYNFTEMTKNIGTFTAAGVDLDTSTSAIKGIANLAAVSGSTSQQASTAMYQLSQALAAGRVSLMDWNSVVNAGMGGQVFQDALKRTADVMNKGAASKAIKKYGSFRESLTQGEWLSTDVLTETLNQFTMAAEEGTEQWETYKKSLKEKGYTEEQAVAILKMANTATDAATKVKTFTQLWDTLKESAQSGWTQTWEIIVGDFGEAKSFLTEISDRVGSMIGESAEARNKVLSGGLSSGWKQLLDEGIADETGFKETIKDVAKEHGVAIDDMIKAEQELDATLTDDEAFQNVLKKNLKDGKISSDMLAESVHKMADEMSGMSTKELQAAGYTAEHVEAIKKLSKGLKDGSISMDEFVKKMTRTSGRENIIQALWNSFDAVMNIIGPVKEAFSEIFPPITGEQVYSFTERLVLLTEKFKVFTEKYGPQFKSIFKGIFSVLRIGVDAISAVVKGAGTLVSKFSGVEGGILGVAAAIGNWLSGLRESIQEGNIFGRAIGYIVTILSGAIDEVKAFGSSIKESFRSADYSGFVGFFKGLWDIVKSITSGILDAFSGIGAAVANAFGENTFGDLLESGGLAALSVGLYKLISNLNSPFESFSDLCEGLTGDGGVLENVIDIVDGVRDCFKAYQQQLQAEALIKIAKAIAILAAAIFVISTIDPSTLGQSLAAITVLFAELMGSMAIFSQFSPAIKGVVKIVPLMLSMSAALLILSGALKIISSIDPDRMVSGLVGVTGGMGVLVGALHSMPDKQVAKAGKTIRSMAISLIILGAAMKIMASMSWSELGKGLVGVAGGLGLMVAALKLLPKNWAANIDGLGKITSTSSLISAGITMIAFAAAMKILASAVKDFGELKWVEIAKGLAAMAGSMAIFVGAIKLLPKTVLGNVAGHLVGLGVGMIAMATSMVILNKALSDFSGMTCGELAKGLGTVGVSMFIMATALKAMTGTLSGSAALLIAAGALAILVPSIKSLGEMSIASIVKGLGVMAGAFIIMGIAGTYLGPLIPILTSLMGTLALFGLSVMAIGAGLTLIGMGISSIATSLAVGAASIVAGITVIITGILDLVPTIVGKLGEAIKSFAVVIGDCAPEIAESLLKLVSEVLVALAEYTPKIADSLFDLLIGVLDVLAARMPELIVATIKVISAFFQGIVDALKSIDTTSLFQGSIAVALLTALMYALSGVAALIPSAMVGVLGLGAVIAELALVLAAIGALGQIPGLTWLIGEGGNVLQTIGTALGQFVGGIVGGVAKGFTSSLPQIGTDLSTFMTNVQPFIDGAKNIDTTLLDGIKTLVGAVLVLTGADIVSSLASFITGGSSLADFGAQLVPFGESMRQYGQAVAGVDAASITASATAAKALASVAQAIPKEGGLASLFGGENDLVSFASQLVPFGTALKAYSLAVAGIDPQAIIGSAVAAKALAQMTSVIPNEGGIVAWFTGENSLANFSGQLASLGLGLKAFSIATAGIDPASIVGAAGAAKALADMMSVIPNEGGIVAWLTGENSVSRFGNDLLSLGLGLRNFAIATTGIVPDSIIASANAAKALAEMMNVIPNEGGIVAWLTGENSVADFSDKLATLGFGLKGFAIATTGIVPESIIAAANAAKALAEMMNVIPNEGGIVAWFTGENSLANFSSQLISLGYGLKNFAIATTGIVPESIVAAANAAKALAQMTSVLPNEGGVKAWFTGENSLANFASKLPILGMGLLGFAMATTGINTESVIAASNAAKVLAQMTNTIPNEGGIKAWFSGESSIATFAAELPKLGRGLSGFSNAVADINAENITAAANAAKALAQMVNVIPKEGGIKAWFTGETSISNFADKLPALGKGLSGFSEAVAGINPESTTAAANAAKALAQMADTTPKNTDKLVTFGENLATFGGKLKTYYGRISEISPGAITISTTALKTVKTATDGLNPSTLSSAAKAIDELVKTVKKMSSVSESSVNGFVSAMKKLGETNVKSIITAFTNAGPKLLKAGKDAISKLSEGVKSQEGKMKTAGQNAVAKLAEGIKGKSNSVKTAIRKIVNDCATAIKTYQKSFNSAGAYLVAGFCAGISANSYKAAAKARAMAKAAEKAARDELDINSPSKVFRALGYSVPEGFAVGIDALSGMARKSAVGMADDTIAGMQKAIANVADLVSGDIDVQPTISPVLDLSNVKTGAGAIAGILGGDSAIGVSANVGAIATMMNSRQNGANEDVVNAINKLRNELGNVGNTTYSINGITYDDGSNIASAVKDLARYARMERRV